ncbi:MAG: fructosamine kinase family protein [Gammaproteobacteria bacterium]|nr:fructosamine kinase family protein [Gammaproteobacteria bacterium]
MFEAEADGLRELSSAGAIRVPAVFDCGIRDGHAFIAMERFAFDAPTAATEWQLGECVAALHRHTAPQFGWFRNNTIGPTPQQNTLADDWPGFFREHRLEFQLDLASSNGYGAELAEAGRRLAANLDSLFDRYTPVASLLHGDLWGGNWGSVNGEPVVFDPAVYYGDRETDIAMSKLFGGFGQAFYTAYEKTWPMAPGHERRLKLYQLYHVLNHLNLFGRSYLEQARRLIRELA